MDQKDFDLFFEAPEPLRPSPNVYGTLFLLRRDIIQSFRTHPANWLGTMGVLAGIDLLAKFFDGDDEGQVTGRYKKFTDEYFFEVSNSPDSETIYQLRNSMLHSFGLRSTKKISGVTKEFHFVLVADKTGGLIKSPKPDLYVISVPILHKHFEQAIQKYHEAVRNEASSAESVGDFRLG
jgi:hypothetical protein